LNFSSYTVDIYYICHCDETGFYFIIFNFLELKGLRLDMDGVTNNVGDQLLSAAKKFSHYLFV